MSTFLEQIPTVPEEITKNNDSINTSTENFENLKEKRKMSSGITTAQYFRSSIGGRRSSRQMSTTQMMLSNRKGRLVNAPSSETDADYLDEIAKAPRPRFTSSLSLEAQYAILKGYEDRLRSKLSKSHPEFINLLQSSPDPPSDFKGKSLSLKGVNLQSSSAVEYKEEDNQITDLRATKSFKSVKSVTRFEIQEDKQAELSRRFQFAQYLNDYFVYKIGEPSLNQRLLSEQKEFNPVKKFNWWSAWWASDFNFENDDKTKP